MATPLDGDSIAAELARLVVQQATDYAILTTDPEGLVTSWSPGAAKIFGYPEDEILGRPSDVLFTREDRRRGEPAKELSQALESGCGVDERWHLRQDGGAVFLNGSVHPLRDEKGRLTGFAKIARDETARKVAAEEALELQKTLTREVSHRVKNSLGIIAGFLHLQARGAATDETRDALKAAQARVLAVAQVHDQLWRADTGEMVSLDVFLGSLCRGLEGASSFDQVSFEGDPILISTDTAIPLALITNELVTNALKYAYAGASGPVWVNLVDKGDRGVLCVRDQGQGLPPGFDLDQPSTGLGMKVVTGLTRQIGGRLKAQSLEQGTRFSVEFGVAARPIEEPSRLRDVDPFVDPALSAMRVARIAASVGGAAS